MADWKLIVDEPNDAGEVHVRVEDENGRVVKSSFYAKHAEEQEPEAIAALLDRFRLIADAPRVRRERDALLEALVDVGLNFAEYVDGGGESRFKLPESVKTALAACQEEPDGDYKETLTAGGESA